MKALIFLAMLVLCLPVFAFDGEMKELIRITDGSMYAGNVPAGYRSVSMKEISPRGGLETFLKKTTQQKMKDWKKFVHTSGEYSHVSADERRRIAANPLSTMEVSALLEISEVYAIYKGNKLIGYFIEITDHVQGAIYQDGAWYDAFFDAELNLVEAFDQSA